MASKAVDAGALKSPIRLLEILAVVLAMPPDNTIPFTPGDEEKAPVVAMS